MSQPGEDPTLPEAILNSRIEEASAAILLMDVEEMHHGSSTTPEQAAETSFIPFRAPPANMTSTSMPHGLPNDETIDESRASVDSDVSRTLEEDWQSDAGFQPPSDPKTSVQDLEWKKINTSWGPNETEKLMTMFNNFRAADQQKDSNPCRMMNIRTIKYLCKLATNFDIASAENAILHVRQSRVDCQGAEKARFRHITGKDVKLAYENLKDNAAARSSRLAAASSSAATMHGGVSNNSRDGSAETFRGRVEDIHQEETGSNSLSPIVASSGQAGSLPVNGTAQIGRKRYPDFVRTATAKRMRVDRDGESSQDSLVTSQPDRSITSAGSTEEFDQQPLIETEMLGGEQEQVNFRQASEQERHEPPAIEKDADPDAIESRYAQLRKATEDFIASDSTRKSKDSQVDQLREELIFAKESIAQLERDSIDKVKVIKSLLKEAHFCPDMIETETLKGKRSEALTGFDKASGARKLKQKEAEDLQQKLATAEKELDGCIEVCKEQSDNLDRSKASVCTFPMGGISAEDATQIEE